MPNKVKFKIGEIEFKAKGDAELIERERKEFISNLLPIAVDAIMRTKTIQPIINTTDETVYDMLPQANNSNEKKSMAEQSSTRTNLITFINEKGIDNENDFTICAAYYEEFVNNIKVFSVDRIKELYDDARRPLPSNVSMTLTNLIKKGHIMDSPEHPNGKPKKYILTVQGIQYVENFQPKETKEKKISNKPRKTIAKSTSTYVDINIDDLNLKNYPEIKSLKSSKEKMMMILYIITNENKGEWFTSTDIIFLMTDVFGEAVNIDQIKGVFKNHKTWFKVESIPESNKGVKRKLLNGGKEFAEALIKKENSN